VCIGMRLALIEAKLALINMLNSNLTQATENSILHYMIKFVSDLWYVGGVYRVHPVSSTNNTDHHDITEILLKVALKVVFLSFFFWSLC
jgi:hypothetical protein